MHPTTQPAYYHLPKPKPNHLFKFITLELQNIIHIYLSLFSNYASISINRKIRIEYEDHNVCM
jgi:hypothetical protein